MDESIILTDVSKSFKLSKKQRSLNSSHDIKKIAVNSVSLSVYKGEIFGLLGPNGAGKTTTLRIISGLIKPDEGSVLIDGESIQENPNIKKKICFLTNDLKLEEGFSINYLFSYFAKLYGMTDAQCEERKRILFSRFGIHDFCETKIGELSTGMKQKASLVISLVHDPDIIIFDEPTNGLDIITAKLVIDYLLELKSQGKTILISTHIMELIEKICDRVGIIIQGSLVYQDTMQNALQQDSMHSIEHLFFDLYKNIGGDPI